MSEKAVNSGGITATKTPKQKVFGIVIDYIVIIGVAIAMALNYQLFIVENHYAPAGINGIATMIQYKTGFSLGYFSLIVSIPLCVAAVFIVSRQYAARTFCFSVFYSCSYIFFNNIDISAFKYNANGQNMIFPVIISGTVSGLIYAVLFQRNSSTGGSDVISKFLSVKKPEFNFFWVMFAINAAVAAASFFVYAKTGENGEIEYDYLPVCLCIMYCFISSFVGNYFIKGTKRAYEFTVVTAHPDEIAGRIQKELRHSCTKLSAIGTYTGQYKDMLICVVNKHQINDFKNILTQYDDTFAFSEVVNDTFGNFKRIR